MDQRCTRKHMAPVKMHPLRVKRAPSGQRAGGRQREPARVAGRGSGGVVPAC
jgi:hypothetical protein